MKWIEVKKEIEEEIKSIQNKVDSGKYDINEINVRVKNIYEQLVKINNFVKHYDEVIGNIAKKVAKGIEDNKGLESFIQTMKIAPVDLTTFIDKGWNFMVEEQYDDAVEILEKAHSLAPNDIKTMNLLGWAYIHKEEYDKAMMVYQNVLNKDAKNALAKNNLGFVCFKKGIYGEAIEHLTSVLSNTKDVMSLIYANFYLGLIYFEREMYDDAEEFFKNTLKNGPSHLEAYFYLGLTYEKMGLIKKAVNTFNDIIKKNKYNKWAERAEEKIKELNGEEYEKES